MIEPSGTMRQHQPKCVSSRPAHFAFRQAVSLLFVLVAAPALAQTVSVQLATHELYLGQTTTLQVSVTNARGDVETPKIAEVDGLEIVSLGPPSRQFVSSFRVRRSTLIWSYRITAREVGEFTIPAPTVIVDGDTKTTKPLRLIVSKSETDDLVFVEVKAGNEGQRSTYVGEPIELSLQIWIRPYYDRKLDIKLSPENMWQLISENSLWGNFRETLVNMGRNEIPRGREVFREDSKGEQRAYYLYELDAMIYPQRPGTVEIDDVQLVLNYPESLGYSRRRAFPSALLDDDFFGDMLSPLGRPRLSVDASRPIVVNVEPPDIDVVEVPQDGRPDDYRGAVGSYRIGIQAEPTSVKAGDPITLRIVLQGDGPMELVQAPPLSTVSELTEDFKIESDTLAGFVKDAAKLFTTTIRPLNENVSQIPPIPFSFFNPTANQFETTYSNAIAISVEEADRLELDEIVSSRKNSSKPREAPSTQSDTSPEEPQVVLANYDAAVDLQRTRFLRRRHYRGRACCFRPSPVGLGWLVARTRCLDSNFGNRGNPRDVAMEAVT